MLIILNVPKLGSIYPLVDSELVILFFKETGYSLRYIRKHHPGNGTLKFREQGKGLLVRRDEVS